MWSAECQGERRSTIDLPFQLRIPHSAFRIHVFTLAMSRPTVVSAIKMTSPPTAPADGSSNMAGRRPDRKSTRLNSSHLVISYAVFCLKKKKNNDNNTE